MFNNGDTSIKEMGSTQDGRAGDMMDSMYAYLMRGCPKSKSAEMLTPLKDAGTYSVRGNRADRNHTFQEQYHTGSRRAGTFTADSNTNRSGGFRQ